MLGLPTGFRSKHCCEKQFKAKVCPYICSPCLQDQIPGFKLKNAEHLGCYRALQNLILEKSIVVSFNGVPSTKGAALEELAHEILTRSYQGNKPHRPKEHEIQKHPKAPAIHGRILCPSQQDLGSMIILAWRFYHEPISTQEAP